MADGTAPTIAATPPPAPVVEVSGTPLRSTDMGETGGPPALPSSSSSAEPSGPPPLTLRGHGAPAADAPHRADLDTAREAWLDRPPLVSRADTFEMIRQGHAENVAPAVRGKPAPVGMWRPTVRALTAMRWPALAVGVAAAVVMLALVAWIRSRTLEAPLPVSAPTPPRTASEGVGGSEEPRVDVGAQAPASQWDNAPMVVTFEVEPATATIRFDGKKVRDRQVEVRHDGTTHTVVVSAPGYVTQAQAFVPQQPGRLRVKLRRDKPDPRRR